MPNIFFFLDCKVLLQIMTDSSKVFRGPVIYSYLTSIHLSERLGRALENQVSCKI